MTKKHADAALIQALGGPAEVARLLDLDPANGGVQRVQNWTSRGIPPAVRLQHLDIFGQPQTAGQGEAVQQQRAG
ncbi:MAG TPA: hypothetical protein VGU03_11040 [Frateuria sp.]|uniref:hypothetical protein n=1 Tax=Frateuria sp. TaxID=2211372 RepID=UPI002DE7D8CB|nr:hypothetical protein [Frateuria sp.]